MSLIGWIIVYAMLFLFITQYFSNSGKNRPVELSPSALVAEMQSGNVKSLSFSQGSLNITGTKLLAEKKEAFTCDVINQMHLDEIRKLAAEKNIPYEVKPLPNPLLGQFMQMALWMVLLMLLFAWIGRQQNKQLNGKGGPLDFMRSKAKQSKINPKDRKTFADVAGCDEAKQELMDIVDYLRDPRSFTGLGGKIPKGVLMNGEPGTGKTLLAKAVAGEAGVPFFSANGADFVEMFVGVGAARVRSLFEDARKSMPCVVFIDEIDAVGKKRGLSIGGGHDEREQTLNQLLSEMDGFSGENSGIIVIAATNREDVLDEALIRPGRFDRHVHVPRPDLAGRKAILEVHGKNKKFSPEVNLLDIAKDTTGMVGADLENILNEAALLAARKNKQHIEQDDLQEAVDKISMGPARKSMKISKKEKEMTAYHEAGHTLVGKLTPGHDPVHKVTIMPRGPSLGHTKFLPEEDRYSHSKSYLEALVLSLVGGRVAEEIVFGEPEVTTGASSDFQRATLILRKMVYEFGFSDLGMVVYQQNSDFFGNPAGSDISPVNKEKMENEVNRLLKEAVDKVRVLLNANRNKLNALAKALLEKETLHGKEIEDAINSAQ